MIHQARVGYERETQIWQSREMTLQDVLVTTVWRWAHVSLPAMKQILAEGRDHKSQWTVFKDIFKLSIFECENTMFLFR